MRRGSDVLRAAVQAADRLHRAEAIRDRRLFNHLEPGARAHFRARLARLKRLSTWPLEPWPKTKEELWHLN